MNTERPDHDDAAAGTAEAASEAKKTPESRAEGGTAPRGKAGTGATAAPLTGAESEPGAGTGAVPGPVVASGAASEPETGTGATSEPTARADAASEPEPSSVPEPQAEPDAVPGPGAEPGDKGTAAPETGTPFLPGRHRSPLVAASVAAAVLLVGGGGAYVVTSASGSSRGGTAPAASGHGTPPPLALDGYTAPGTAPGGADAGGADTSGAGAGTGGTNGIAPGEPNPYGRTYRVAGTLPDGPGSAPVYAAGGAVTRDEVARLARALGLEGAPRAGTRAWTVGPAGDGSGPVLRVSRQGPGTWTFSRYAPGTDDCAGVTRCTSAPAAPAADPVSAAAAKKAAAPVLKALGQEGAAVDAGQVRGAQRVVNADPVVGGLPTYGWATGLTVGASGDVVAGSGRLKAPAKGHTYPVLSARETLDLMNAAPGPGHRMGIGGCASPVPLKDRLEAPCGSPASTAAPRQDAVTVERAVFGLATHSAGGRQTLVPSWLFEARTPGAADLFTVTYPAVDPAHLTPAGPAGGTSAAQTSPSAPAAPRDVRVTGYSTDGDSLTVRFEGGVCSDYTASAAEGAGRVTVTVTEEPRAGTVCIMIAKVQERTVRLDRPLGDRTVVGSDGRAVPQARPGARLPEASPQAR
ncbi:hypothetical protein ABZ920_24745 [Streptomyces sp. NPDC046831]|uniref:hypothetical protein n=1 Tax=Streptomyces sp. NPDC046831 TaxID=3154805 RepID=UPI0033C5552E